MAQHDYVIANGTGAAVRSDLNNALAAIVSQNSGATEPATMYAYQWWADTSTGLLKLRNGANNAWITLRELDGTLTIEAGTVSAPGLAFASDLNTGVWSPGADQFAIATNGVERVDWGTSEVVFNDGGTNYDFRVEGDTNANLLFVDASADAVGIGTNAPNSPFEVGTAGINLDGAIAALPDAAADSAAFIARTASTGSAPFDQAGSIIYRPRVSSTAGRSSHIFYTGSPSTIRMVIDETGNVGIGTTSPIRLFHALDSANSIVGRVESGQSSSWLQFAASGTGTASRIGDPGGSTNAGLAFMTADTERARIDSSGRLLVGTSTSRPSRIYYPGGDGASNPGSQLEATGTGSTFQIVSNQAGAVGSAIVLGKSRGTATGSIVAVQNGDQLGTIQFNGIDVTTTGDLESCAGSIACEVDGTPGANDMPGRLVFSTTADGASSPTERMRITSDGRTLIGTTNTSPVSANVAGTMINSNGEFQISRDNATPLLVNRKTSDGNLVEFWQDGANEGSISVSGTTVSYNGAHLSRWSQLPSGAERIEILRGSVLSNIDEMCEWGDEDNEQLNRMKVSDIEGDKNVSGVFQAWDDDDDTYTNDFYCAMTGDFIIRIAQGVTVERGDLLMSAGDGTAKPQDDDIIRSKTVAKVTSTTVSCTYDDGSYCVPCVLMAC